MVAVSNQVWLFAILAVVVVVALILGRRFMFKGGGVEVRTGNESGGISVADQLKANGNVGNVTGVRGAAPAQDVSVLNRATVDGNIGDITGVDAGPPQPKDPSKP